MKKIDYYRSIQDDEKVNQWLHKLNCISEEEWYENASPEIKHLLHNGHLPVYHSDKVKATNLNWAKNNPDKVKAYRKKKSDEYAVGQGYKDFDDLLANSKFGDLRLKKDKNENT